MSQRILLMEPDCEAQQLLARALEAHGFEVTCPIDSYVGIEFALQSPFDLVLLSDRMPLMDGQAFDRHLGERGVRIPTLVFCDKAKTAARYTGNSVVALVPKPFRIDRLIAQIQALIQTA